MSEEEINIAIAECCGWTHTKTINNPNETAYGRHPVHTADVTWELPLPNYCGDLNAMHEAFRSLGRHWEICQVGDGYLCRIQFGRGGRDVVAAGLELCPVMAEAFLRTLGKWSE